jgi:hypothetical protein
MEKFYFKSYDNIIASAGNLEELKNAIIKLAKEDPGCVNYHLREGHIVQWLNYIGELDTAKSLTGVSDVKNAMIKLGIEDTKKKDNFGNTKSIRNTGKSNRKMQKAL